MNKRKNDIKRGIIDFSVAVISEIAEYAKQEDAPIYEGDEVVDYFVRLSDVNEAVCQYLPKVEKKRIHISKDIPMGKVGSGMSFEGKIESLELFLSQNREKSEL